MKKVKVIQSSSCTRLQSDINEFLSTLEDRDLHKVSTTCFGSNLICTIFYNEVEKVVLTTDERSRLITLERKIKEIEDSLKEGSLGRVTEKQGVLF